MKLFLKVIFLMMVFSCFSAFEIAALSEEDTSNNEVKIEDKNDDLEENAKARKKQKKKNKDNKNIVVNDEDIILTLDEEGREKKD